MLHVGTLLVGGGVGSHRDHVRTGDIVRRHDPLQRLDKPTLAGQGRRSATTEVDRGD